MKLNDIIKTLVQQIRDCRRDRSVPILLGQGFTVALQDHPACAARVEGGWNFSGTWNCGTSYWDRAQAELALGVFKTQKPALKLRVAHRNTLRDEAESVATDTIRRLLSIRHDPVIRAAFDQ